MSLDKVPETITIIPAGNHPTQLGMTSHYAYTAKVADEVQAMEEGKNPPSYYNFEARKTRGDYSEHYKSLAVLDDWRQERPGQFVIRQSDTGHYSHIFLTDNPNGRPFMTYCSNIQQGVSNNNNCNCR